MKVFIAVRRGMVVGVKMRDYKGDLAPCEFEIDYLIEPDPVQVLGADFGAYEKMREWEKEAAQAVKKASKPPEKATDSFTRPFSFTDDGLPICRNCSGSGVMWPHSRICQVCEGKGIYPAGKAKCGTCDGWGKSSVDGRLETCPDCKGAALQDAPDLVYIAGRGLMKRLRPEWLNESRGAVCGKCSQTGCVEIPQRPGEICECNACDGVGWVGLPESGEWNPDLVKAADNMAAGMEKPESPLLTVSVDMGMSEQEFSRQLVEAGGEIGARVAEEREKQILKAFVDGPPPDPVVNDLGETKGQALARMMGMDAAGLVPESCPRPGGLG